MSDCTPPTDDSQGRDDASNRGRSASRRRRSRSRRSHAPNTGGSGNHDQATIGVKPGTDVVSALDASPPIATASCADSRYESICEVGRGGWGVVEKAVDRQLEREVAVKRFTDAQHVSEQERQRFIHEAKVTSQLQHPGIVPVHEVDDRGDTFYVMKLLHGDTLHDAIIRHHSQASAAREKTAFRFGISLEPLLQRFVDVCNAVAYAHRRGVVHRDLKPANVMIGDFGETVVLDWGLAHAIHAPHASSSSAEQNATDGPSTDGDGTGAIEGTPAYMSPEQAAGDLRRIGPASDIYSLGVMLYAIVAGRHPYQGGTVDEILQQVQAAQYPDILILQPLTPPALAAIIRKAMAAAPADRYPNAERLAADIRRWIAGEAVTVHRESLLARGVRWVRHHQGMAATVAGSLTALLIAALVFGVVIHRAHRAERLARLDAERSHRSAVLRLAEMRDATDSWLIDLSRSLELHPGMSSLREELLARAADQYAHISDPQNLSGDTLQLARLLPPLEDPDAIRRQTAALKQLEQAKVLRRLGDIRRLAGQADQANQNYLAADRILGPTSGDGSPLYADAATAALQSWFELERVNILNGRMMLVDENAADPIHTTGTND